MPRLIEVLRKFVLSSTKVKLYKLKFLLSSSLSIHFDMFLGTGLNRLT